MCVNFHCLPAQCVAHVSPSSPSSFALDPRALFCALSEPLWSCSLSVFRPLVPIDLHSASPCNIQQKQPFFLTQSLCALCMCVCMCVCAGVVLSMIEVCGSFYLRELLQLVWQERPCYADHPVSVISHLRNSAEWKYGRLWFLSPLLPLIYKWIHLVFMRRLVGGTAVGWSGVYSIFKVYWHWLCWWIQ